MGAATSTITARLKNVTEEVVPPLPVSQDSCKQLSYDTGQAFDILVH